MIAIGTVSAIQAVVRAANATRRSDREQILGAVREALGMPPEQARAAPTEEVLTVAEAARRLAKSRRTVQSYATAGLLRGVRSGRSRKLVGIPASEIDAFIARASALPQEVAS